MNRIARILVAGWPLALLAGTAQAEMTPGAAAKNQYANDIEAPVRVEDQPPLPALPRDGDLIEFYVGPTTPNHFYIDGATLAVGEDGIVRYTLVVKTAGGATNVTYEGIHCKAREYRLYATGRADGTWAPVRSGAWQPIENKPINRHHAALSRDIFCPAASPVGDADEGRKALRRSWPTRMP